MQLLGWFVFQLFFLKKDGGSGCVPAFLVKGSFNSKDQTSCLSQHPTPERKQKAPKVSTRHKFLLDQIPLHPEGPRAQLREVQLSAVLSSLWGNMQRQAAVQMLFPTSTLSNLFRMVITGIGSYWHLVQCHGVSPWGPRHKGCVRQQIDGYKDPLSAASRRWQSSDAKYQKVYPSHATARRHTVLERKRLWALSWPQQHPVCLSQLLAWRHWPCSSEWRCHKTVGTFWLSAWICVASHISQAFPAVSHISGNFLIERTGRQPHFSASYSCLLCIIAITLKKILDCVVGQNNLRLNWSNTEAKR